MRILGNNLEETGGKPPFPTAWRPFWNKDTEPFLSQEEPFPFSPPTGVPCGMRMMSVGDSGARLYAQRGGSKPQTHALYLEGVGMFAYNNKPHTVSIPGGAC